MLKYQTFGDDNLRKLQIALFVMVVCSAFSFKIYALPIDSAKEDMDSQVITIKGSDLIPNQLVVVELASADDVIASNGIVQSIPVNAVKYINAKAIDGLGNYELTLLLPKSVDSSKMLIRAKTPSCNNPFDFYMEYYSYADVNRVFDTINNAISNKNTAIIATLLDSEIDSKILLNSDTLQNLYGYLKKYDMGPVYSELVNVNLLNNVSEFKAIFERIFVPYAVNISDSVNLTKTIISQYAELLGVANREMYKITMLTELGDIVKNTVFESIYNTTKNLSNDLSKEQIEELVCHQILIAAVKYASYYTEVNKVMKRYNDEYLHLDFTKYNSLSNKYAVDSAMMGNNSNFTTISQLVIRFNELVDEESAKSSPRSVGSSSTAGTTNVSYSSVKPVESTNTFVDLLGFEWAANEIAVLNSKGIISGYQNKFEPERSITREEFLKILIEALDLKDNAAECSFNDVDENAWYYRYVAAAQKNGIVNGKSVTEFGVGDKITREEMALMCYRAVKLKNSTAFDEISISGLLFEDSSEIEPYALHSISVMNGAEIIKGVGENKFSPKQSAIRAQSAVIITRIMNYLAK